MTHCVQVALEAPFHSGIGHLLSYTAEQPLPPGTLVRVPLGSREVLGIVWDEAAPDDAAAAIDAASLRPVAQVLDGQAPLASEWRRLMEFAARYYQRSLGEVALMALPAALQDQGLAQWHKRLQKIARDPAEPAAKPKARRRPRAVASAEPALAQEAAVDNAPAERVAALQPAPRPVLTAQQQAVLDALQQGGGTYLLHGVTGSGKSEVYLRQAEALLRQDPQAQVLFMVPEINLTPQWQQLLQQRFGPWLGPDCVAVLHSGLTPVQRLNHWLAVHQGRVRLVLGTRMAVLASFAQLRLIVVDEEHDASYKQQDGARYHARDLAVWRGKQLGVPVVLGSATPSLESWWNSRPASAEAPAGHYRRLSMPERVGQGQLAALRMVDMRQLPRETVLAPSLLQAMEERLVQGEQCMVLLNRRGYAPVLCCGACGWKSDCPHCSAHQVLHKADRSLRCHHCGYASRIPRHCPQCGSTDLAPLGRGTEQLEEMLQQALDAMALPDGRAPLVLRIDADSTRHKGALQQSLAQVHSGAVDVLVGTQMIAKGHDFRRIGLVAVAQPDGALYSSDFRAPERLFALLMQAAGRAGRDAGYMRDGASSPELWVQTREPGHPLFAALARHDYEGFACQQLHDRQQAGMPPFTHQALLRADARSQETAQAFLRMVQQQARAQALPGHDWVTVYPPVPLGVQRVANAERAQMLLESPSRGALQAFLQALQPLLQAARSEAGRGLLRWLVDVDPLQI
ncbi:primosomal protein N' [Corticibacter populi]|uniref:Replication restart protein PriA n=1 Tax=Corticibacter populi TaxID=1550736 RepID=A0A3M6QS37_9BURK|nr:primosomal protein N' [Corticibacter populi]RMX05844.1 primosomal protein N' [Corticibacter populi]RZS30840.1 replication restart DNA helicase PriA [Corticibacter populi]